MVVPNKHTYEVIYNRLGNDLLLWTPVYLRVKQYLFHQAVPDPLRDPDAEFFQCISGAWQKPAEAIEMSRSYDAGDNLFDLFPKSNLPGLMIHTDTFVSLSVNRGFVSICSTVCDENSRDSGNFIFSAVLSMLELQTSVGLERSPDICLLGLSIQDIRVSFGKTLSRILNVRGTHFNERPTGEASTVLLERTRWHHFSCNDVDDDDNLVTLTSKILFDSKANLKTIDLGLVLKETSLCWSLSSAPPQWINWLVDFFTVVVSHLVTADTTQPTLSLYLRAFDDKMSSARGATSFVRTSRVRINSSLIRTQESSNYRLL